LDIESFGLRQMEQLFDQFDGGPKLLTTSL
jgi:hypothetical protein